MSLEKFPQASEALMKLVKFMTWSRFFKTFATMLLFISMYTLFENRQMLYKGIMTSSSSVRTMIEAPLSKTTIEAVDVLLSKKPGITGIQFVSVDFKTNTRKSEYFRSLNPTMELQIHEYMEKKIVATPFFTDDPVNNERNVSLINGEFICYPIQKTILNSRFPLLNQFADTICSVSIPPYPGYFSGYITFYVRGMPSNVEINELRAAARKMSIATYDAEITK